MINGAGNEQRVHFHKTVLHLRGRKTAARIGVQRGTLSGGVAQIDI